MKENLAIFLAFYFEIIIDAQEVANIVQRAPIHSSPSLPRWDHLAELSYTLHLVSPMGPSCTAIAEY